MHSRFVPPLALAALLSILSGCAREHASPTVTSPVTSASHGNVAGTLVSPIQEDANTPGFYPLDPGNRWSWARTFQMMVIPDHGDPYVADTVNSHIEAVQTCLETRAGRVYQIERNSETTDNGTFTYWIRYRQDGAGLYEYDDTTQPDCEEATAGSKQAIGADDTRDATETAWLATRPAAERAAWSAAIATVRERARTLDALLGTAPRTRATSAAPGELTRLVYPLHPGASWIVRPDPRFSGTVLGFDPLRTPAGTFVAPRIRIDSEFFGANDLVQVWYGRQGLLQVAYHLEGVVTDNSGNILGKSIAENRQTLTSIELTSGRTAAH